MSSNAGKNESMSRYVDLLFILCSSKTLLEEYPNARYNADIRTTLKRAYVSSGMQVT